MFWRIPFFFSVIHMFPKRSLNLTNFFKAEGSSWKSVYRARSLVIEKWSHSKMQKSTKSKIIENLKINKIKNCRNLKSPKSQISKSLKSKIAKSKKCRNLKIPKIPKMKNCKIEKMQKSQNP